MTDLFSEGMKRDVVAADTGENIGEVKRFVVDATATRIEALQIGGKGKKALLVAWDDLRSYGSAAIMVEHQEAAKPATTEYEIEAAKGDIDLIKSRVLSTMGVELGHVKDVEFDETTGTVISLHTEQGIIEAAKLRSLGSYAVIVDA